MTQSQNDPKHHTPEPWFYEPADSGDSSVGMQATPPTIFAEVKVGEILGEPNIEGVAIAELHDPYYRAPREEWTIGERHFAEHPDEDYGDYPPGVRFVGSADANGQRIVECVNWCAGYDGDVLKTLKSLKHVREQLLYAQAALRYIMKQVQYVRIAVPGENQINDPAQMRDWLTGQRQLLPLDIVETREFVDLPPQEPNDG